MRLTVQVIIDKPAIKRIIGFATRDYIASALKSLKRVFDRLYKRPGFGHSRPGEPPRIQTGELGELISEAQPGDLEGELIFEADYASFLEEGTVHLRPYLQRTVDGFLAQAAKGGALQGLKRAA